MNRSRNDSRTLSGGDIRLHEVKCVISKETVADSNVHLGIALRMANAVRRNTPSV